MDAETKKRLKEIAVRSVEAIRDGKSERARRLIRKDYMKELKKIEGSKKLKGAITFYNKKIKDFIEST